MIYGVIAYLGWGLFPAYFPILLPAGPVEILAQRIMWTAILMMIIITLTRGWKELRAADLGTWLRVVVASLFIAGNWLIYVIAVNSGHVTEAALGYFINPLVSVVFGIIFFKEQLRKMQMSAVAIATVGVLVLTFLSGQPPYLALSLAFTFGVYGVLKKEVKLSAIASLTAETLVLFPFAFAYIVWLEISGQGTFFNNGIGHSALLMSSGLVTAIPLLMFALAAKAIPLSTVGMLQYLTPTMQMLWALFVVNESVEPMRWFGFVFIWIAITIYITDSLLKNRQ
ncbi:Protein RarD [Corynebacterium deserti GIMN1.010]|uniref:Protein RarD n=1 Tax=Corynebacterium deserti GIMN1.010 TaxID=931089 RepID=A0A0M4CJ46_9CORY|nr:EamA family transporter RarD [Corynebacterium deserti]ALC06308.1 Protein RarD [Corynebacterium deserti GIMN1.010]